MVEGACKKFVVIVDESKLVNYIGGSGLAMPVEFTASRLQNLFQESGCVAKLKTLGEKAEPYVTDNGNYIIDLYFKQSIGDLKAAAIPFCKSPVLWSMECSLIWLPLLLLQNGAKFAILANLATLDSR
ncbi:hypothetical protein Ahy_A04g018720 [Arachis hypogaea]|uniref:Ribose-5-phosphate isomerase n=1 Tax=Arachis hypogaea TaxID=3818 RepID=A0A445DEE5_ARAHY|nr:hypothetical protein Ahy_A04g018720 [Arachis hypogaea]